MHQNSMLLFEKYASKYFTPAIDVLEIGARIPSAYMKALGDTNINWDYLEIDGGGLGSDIRSMSRTEKLD